MALAEHDIDWQTFDQDNVQYPHGGDEILTPVNSDPLPDGDRVWLTVGDPPGIPATRLRVVLVAAPAVTWFKEIKAFDAQGHSGQAISTQDHNHGPVEMELDLDVTKHLVFTKGKAFNIHTGMYALSNLELFAGKLATFTWQTD